MVLEELKSLSSRVMFLAVSPEDTLQVGDYAPFARPPAPPQAAVDTDGTAAGPMMPEGMLPFTSFANLFQGGNGAPTGNGRLFFVCLLCTFCVSTQTAKVFRHTCSMNLVQCVLD